MLLLKICIIHKFFYLVLNELHKVSSNKKNIAAALVDSMIVKFGQEVSEENNFEKK